MSVSIQPILQKASLDGIPSARETVETRFANDDKIQLELRIKEIGEKENPYKLLTGSKIKENLSRTALGLGGLLSMVGPETARLVMSAGTGVQIFKSTKEKIGDIIQQRKDYKEFEKNRLTRIQELRNTQKETEDIAPILPSSTVATGGAMLTGGQSTATFQSDVLSEMQRSNQLFTEFLDELRDRKFDEKTRSSEDSNILRPLKSKLDSTPGKILSGQSEPESKSWLGTIADWTMTALAGKELLDLTKITGKLAGMYEKLKTKITGIPKILENAWGSISKVAKEGFEVAKSLSKPILEGAKSAIKSAPAIAATAAAIASKSGIKLPKSVTQIASKSIDTVKSVGSKLLPKSLGKSLPKALAKRVPFVSLGIGGAFAANEYSKGNYGRAAAELLSGALGPLGLPIDVALMMTAPSEAEPSIGPTPPLLETIAHAEGTSDVKAKALGFASGYDVSFAYGKYNPKGHKPISQMTIGEVKSLQRDMIRKQRVLGIPADDRSSAVGKYQLIQSTLQEQQKKLGLKDSDVFSPEVQDMIGQSLLQRRGLSDFKKGKISATAFQYNLAREFASIPDPETGKSAYGQSVGISTEEIQSAIAGDTNTPSTAMAQKVPSSSLSPAVASSGMGMLLSNVSTNNSNLQTQMAARQMQPQAIPVSVPASGGVSQPSQFIGSGRPVIKPRAEEPYFYEMQKKALFSSIA